MTGLLILTAVILTAAVIYTLAARPGHRHNGIRLEHEITRPRRFTQNGWQ